MSPLRRMAFGTGVLIFGQITGQALGLIRNVLVARLISPDDFGVAATFVVSMALLEMAANMSIDRLLVQAPDGNEREFQSTAHTVQALRGVLVSLAMLLMAYPFAYLFGIPEALWGFQLIALAPLIKGFAHLDPKRFHREYRFGRDVVCELVPQAAALLLLWPLSMFIRDYALMLYILIAQAVCLMLMTHMLSRTPYRWAWNKPILMRFLSFGWPLMLNGVVLFALAQGDRVIVGANYDMAVLGAYSAAAIIAMSVTTMFAKVSSNIFLPMLSKVQDDKDRFQALYSAILSLMALLSAAIGVCFILNGDWLIALLYGEEYALASTIIKWFAVAHAFRLLKAMVIFASFALADARTALIANLATIVGLPLAFLVAYAQGDIVWLVLCVALSDAFALLIAMGRMRRRHGVALMRSLRPTAVVSGVLLVALAVSNRLDSGAVVDIAVTVLVLALTAAAFFVSEPSLREESRRMVAGGMQWKAGRGEKSPGAP